MFHGIAIAGFAIVVATTLYYRIRSWASPENLDRRQEGVFILATLRPAGLVLWLGILAYLINPSWMTWSSMPLPALVRWSGVGMLLAAVALLAWTLPNLGTNLTDTVVTRQTHTLVTRGPYRWVRHPFYGAMTLLVLALSLMAANWFLLATGVIVIALIVVRTRTEERHLAARFGDDYRAYMRRTGRFVPRPMGRRPRS